MPIETPQLLFRGASGSGTTAEHHDYGALSDTMNGFRALNTDRFGGSDPLTLESPVVQGQMASYMHDLLRVQQTRHPRKGKGKGKGSGEDDTYVGDDGTCLICLEDFEHGAWLVRLVCRHQFHLQCWDTNVAVTQDATVCPTCRGPGTMIARRYRYVHPSTVDPSTLDGGEASDNSYATAQSQTDGSGVVLPWWPTQGQQPEPYYHASVQLPDGRLALVVDVGAWTNLTGSKFARAQADRAAAAGRKPSASKLAKPLRVQGVGSGTPQTTWQCELPIAIPDGSGRAFDHTYTAPTLQGAGEDLPALLGMKTITEHEGVLECGRGKERLTFPGPGGYTIT